MIENTVILYMLVCAICANVGAASLFLYTPVGAFTSNSRVALRFFFSFFPMNVIALVCLASGQVINVNNGGVEILYYATSVMGALLVFSAIKWRRGVQFHFFTSPLLMLNISFWIIMLIVQQNWLGITLVMPALVSDFLGKINLIIICGLSLHALKDRELKNAGERLLSMTLVLSIVLSVAVFGIYVLTMDEILRYANIATSNILITVLMVGAVYCAFFFDRINAHRTEAETDYLSGILNRRAFMHYMNEKKQGVGGSGESGVIVMADIDKFKFINDEYGHDVGDLVIKEMASLFQKSLRENDLCARMGGEEFALFISNANKDSAFAVIDRIRENVSHAKVSVGGVSIGFTASFGYTELSKTKPLTVALREADHAMYKSKQSGRNRVSAYQD